MKSKKEEGGPLRTLPSMDLLLGEPALREYFAALGRDTVKSVISDVLAETRREVLQGVSGDTSKEAVLARVLPILGRRGGRSLVPVVNATGVVIHTNLGRSCLAQEAVEAVMEVSGSYSTLEYDLEAGERGHRSDHVEWLLRQATGAEAALVVNNNAGAVLLCLAALCKGREVVVSRGELVEIGGAFRIPDILSFSGARLVEVGSTNRTHGRDYLEAVGPDTAAVLKVHPSNFRMEGFTSSVSSSELASLAREKGVLSMEDLGSGILVETAPLGLKGEPTVGSCIRDGMDLVTFSGDKMLGGPQIGGVAGRKDLVDRLKAYPLLRALRVDKMTLAGFEVTLRLYLQGRWGEIPTLAMLAMGQEEMKKRARRLAALLKKGLPDARVSVVSVEDAVGGGAFPAESLPGWGVSVSIPGGESSGGLQALLRRGNPPVIAGAGQGDLVFHVRTLLSGDMERICSSFRTLAPGRIPDGR